MLGKQRLQGKRSGNRRYDDQQNNSGKVDSVHHADCKALLCHNQSNLAAGHHANANLEGICPVELADLCCKTAANDLGDKCHNDKADTEQKTHTAKEMEDLKRKWEEKRKEREMKGQRISLNDFIVNGINAIPKDTKQE